MNKYFLLAKHNTCKLIPVVIALLMLMISWLPFNITNLNFFFPNLLLINIFFWTIQASKFMPIYAVFFLGLVEDIFFGPTLGHHALSYVILQFLSYLPKRHVFNMHYIVYLASFSLIALLDCLIEIFNYIKIEPWYFYFFTKWLITCLFYLPCHKFLLLINRSI